MMQVERIWEFLQRLSPLTRSCLLAELERLELCGVEMPGSADIQARLRTELSKDGLTPGAPSPSLYFFAPLEPLLVDSAPEHANFGRIARGSLGPIWEWIGRDLLPIMASDYNEQMKGLIAADKQRQAQQAAATFQTKVTKSLEGILGTPEGAGRARSKLAAYTASPSAYGDLTKVMGALRAREALAKFGEALPARISKFDGALVGKIAAQLDAFRKNNADALPFALALVEGRLKTPWQLIRLATKAARSKRAADVAATPYAIAVSMVLDRIDDKRQALRIALKNNRVVVARDILVDIYNTEYALQVRIRELEESEWGTRLRNIMDAIAAMVDAEANRFPDDVDHVLKSRNLRSQYLLAGRLTYLAWKGRDAISDGAAFCKRLVGQT
ncbi:hypothetical protein [Bradyrhizobium sp.]|uniref:hypothetical protein n=1 Tax=Bradyrhizobium sp. TaxID=376 RepID=UPI003C709C75